jgi:dTDP-glucose 4,6-dehydratase
LIEGIAGEIYNIGSGSRFTNLEIVELISRLMGLEKYENKFIQDRKGHDFRYSLNSTKIKEIFKWSPKVTLEEGLKDLIVNYEIYRRNMK